MPSIPETHVSASGLRHAIGHFATGVAVVASLDEAGEPAGATVSAVSSLSLDPPLVLICLDLASNTLAAVRAHGAFTVNVLAAEHREVSAGFARSSLAATWDAVRHRRGHSGSPQLHDMLATLDCRVEHHLPGGDHEIVVGRVLDVETNPDSGAEPLLHYRGAYARLERA
ncbi:MAG: flavin reductase family protein [Solirubrobacteraceae bacterium]|nr:flavin reductase family protein [Solirubrobacteraceae bacterium]